MTLADSPWMVDQHAEPENWWVRSAEADTPQGTCLDIGDDGSNDARIGSLVTVVATSEPGLTSGTAGASLFCDTTRSLCIGTESAQPGTLGTPERESAHVPATSRILGLHRGSVWASEDFDEPLPDDFWLGSE